MLPTTIRLSRMRSGNLEPSKFIRLRSVEAVLFPFPRWQGIDVYDSSMITNMGLFWTRTEYQIGVLEWRAADVRITHE